MAHRAQPFFIIGAPKCGTTALAHWLDQHAQVFVSPIKEPHYHSTDLANQTVVSRDRYTKLFEDVTEAHRAVGEASTWYLFSETAVPNIEREHPGSRYIVMTRDPAAMAHSLYHHNCRVLHEDQPTFEAAWGLQKDRAAGRSIPRSCAEPAFLQYRAVCSLGTLLERLYQQVPEERVLHVPLAWLKIDPRGEYRRVLAFLGVEDDGRNAFPPANIARGYRNAAVQRLLRLGARARTALGSNHGLGLGKLNERPRPKEELDKEFVAELDEAFADERVRIKRLDERTEVATWDAWPKGRSRE